MTRTRVFFLLLLFTACSVFAVEKPKITLDEFFNYVDYNSVQISPDGNSVVIAADRADWDRQVFRTDLWLYRDDPRGSGSLIQLTQSGRDSVPRWSPDGRWIAFLSERKPPAGKGLDADDDSQDPDDEKSQIYLISPSGGEAFPITLTDEEIHAFSWSADSKTIYFATRPPWSKEQKDAYKKTWKDTIQYRAAERGDTIYALDLAGALERHANSATKDTSETEKDANVPLGARAVASTPWRVYHLEASPEGRRLAFITASISQRTESLEEHEIFLVDLTGSGTPVTPRQLTHNEAFERIITWAKDGRHLFFEVDQGAAEGKYHDYQRRLYWVDADTGELQRWAGEFGGAVLQQVVTADGKALAAGRIATEVQTYSEEDPKSAFTKHAGWPGTYEHLSAAKTSPRVAFAYSSLERPVEVYLADSPDKLEQARPITAFNRLFTERDLPKGKTYQWTSNDGTKVEGMLLYPPGKFETKNLPMLTLIHGGPADADGNHFEADWYQWDRLAASAGWLVFEPNYRGSTGYGDKFILGIIPEIVSAPGKDILSGVDALVKDGLADPQHLAVGGYSYGGYMTNWLITQTTRFKAAVTGAGAVEHVANWGNDDTVYDDAYFLGGLAWEVPKRYQDEAAIYQINKVRTPTHVVGGAQDVRVAVLENYLLERALHTLGIPTTLLIFPGEGHSLDKNPWHGKIKVREELKWLQKYGGI